MRAKSTAAVALLALVSTGIGCGTLFNAKKKTIMFSTEPSGANILIDGNRVGATPYQMELENGKNYTVTFRLDGHQDVSCMIGNTVGAGWVILDILGGVLPIVIDAVTGDWQSLDKSVCTATLAPNPVGSPGGGI